MTKNIPDIGAYMDCKFQSPFAKQVKGSLIELQGQDAKNFLQRLISIDINSIPRNQPTLATFLDATAKPIAVFYVLQKETTFHLFVSQIYTEKTTGYINIICSGR